MKKNFPEKDELFQYFSKANTLEVKAFVEFMERFEDCIEIQPTLLQFALISNDILGLHILKKSNLFDMNYMHKSRNDHNQLTTLHYASAKGKSKVVELLLENEASLVRDQFNRTPLHLACWKGNAETIAKLIEHFGQDILRPFRTI